MPTEWINEELSFLQKVVYKENKGHPKDERFIIFLLGLMKKLKELGRG